VDCPNHRIKAAQDGHPGKARKRQPAALVGADRLVKTNQTFLDHVFPLEAFSEIRSAQTADEPVVPADQFVRRLPVSGLGELDQDALHCAS